MKSKMAAYLGLIVILISSTVSTGTTRTFDKIIAYVNDDVITQRELDTLVKQRAMELQQVYRFTEEEALQESGRQQKELLDRLIRQMLLLEAALTLKVTVSTVEVEQYIQEFKDRYQIKNDEELKKQLNREGLTLIGFREQTERNLKAEKLVMGRILPRLQIRDSDVKKFFEENREKLPTKSDKVRLRHIFFAFKPTQAEQDAALKKISDARDEIAQEPTQFETVAKRIGTRQEPTDSLQSQAGMLIEANTETLKKFPETFQNALTNLKAGEFSEPIEGNEGLYLFTVETKTDNLLAFRYLIVPINLTEEAKLEARLRAAKTFAKLEEGEDFNTLAAEHSDDSETREKGGDLGFRALIELNPRTHRAVEALETGTYSHPFETTSGLHIFKVDERNTPELSEAEKKQIIAILRQQRFQEEWDAYTGRLLENAYVKIKL